MNDTAMKHTTRYLTLCLILTCVCKPATADLILGFSTDTGGTFANDFDVQVGNSLDIGIYLRQTGADTILTDEGLVSWGFDLTRDSTALGTISNPLANPVFDSESHNVTTATGFEWEYAESFGFGTLGDDILLGSFKFDATADGTSLFTIEDRVPGAGFANANWFTPFPLATDLDDQIFAPGVVDQYQFTVNSTTAVPEPNSLVMLSCIAGLAIVRRRRTSPA